MDRNFIEIAFGWGHGHIWLHIAFEGPWPLYAILKATWDGHWTLPLGSHNSMVTALGLYVKWPLVRDDSPIQIVSKAIFLVIYGVQMNILITSKVKVP
jgi:hypothetical protein